MDEYAHVVLLLLLDITMVITACLVSAKLARQAQKRLRRQPGSNQLARQTQKRLWRQPGSNQLARQTQEPLRRPDNNQLARSVS